MPPDYLGIVQRIELGVVLFCMLAAVTALVFSQPR